MLMLVHYSSQLLRLNKKITEVWPKYAADNLQMSSKNIHFLQIIALRYIKNTRNPFDSMG